MMRTLCVVDPNRIKRKGKRKNQCKRPALNWDLNLQESTLKNNYRETCPKSGLWKHTAVDEKLLLLTPVLLCFFLSFILFSIPLFLHLSLHHLHTSTSAFALPALKRLSSSPPPGSPPFLISPGRGHRRGKRESSSLPSPSPLC